MFRGGRTIQGQKVSNKFKGISNPKLHGATNSPCTHHLSRQVPSFSANSFCFRPLRLAVKVDEYYVHIADGKTEAEQMA